MQPGGSKIFTPFRTHQGVRPEDIRLRAGTETHHLPRMALANLILSHQVCHLIKLAQFINISHRTWYFKNNTSAPLIIIIWMK
jgi:hypothetical protein